MPSHVCASAGWRRDLAKLLFGCIVAAALLDDDAGPCSGPIRTATNFTAVEVPHGASVQIGVYAFANNDCTPARSPSIRVIGAATGNADVDRVIYEVTSPNGDVDVYDVTIRIH